MKKCKLVLAAIAIITMTGAVNAAGVGYIDYAKVIDNYEYAKSY